MSEHDNPTGADDDVIDELRRYMSPPAFPDAEIEARIRETIARRDVEPPVGVHSDGSTEHLDPRLSGWSEDQYEQVRSGRRHALGAASEESLAARPDRLTLVGEAAPVRWHRSLAARAVLTAAASLAVFIAGAEYGRRTAPISIVVPALSTAADARTDLPYSIQSAGSQYVATLAMFSGQSDSLSLEERRIAREVALAALYSASVELLREAGDDDVLRAVTEMVAKRRSAMGPSTIDAGTRF